MSDGLSGAEPVRTVGEGDPPDANMYAAISRGQHQPTPLQLVCMANNLLRFEARVAELERLHGLRVDLHTRAVHAAEAAEAQVRVLREAMDSIAADSTVPNPCPRRMGDKAIRVLASQDARKEGV